MSNSVTFVPITDAPETNEALARIAEHLAQLAREYLVEVAEIVDSDVILEMSTDEDVICTDFAEYLSNKFRD